MLEKFRNRLLVSLGVLFAPMATIATAEDAANYEQLKEAVDGSAAQINITNNIDFGEDGTTLDIAAATTVSGAARVITSNTNAQTPIFNVSAGNSLTITNLTLRQAVGAGGNATLINSAGNLNLSGVTLQNSAQSIGMSGNGSIVFSGTTDNLISGSIVTGINNAIVNNSTGTLTLEGNMSSVQGTYTQTAGTTKFADNSTYFTGTTNLSNSTLQLGRNVNAASGTIMNLNGNTTVEAKNGNTIASTEVNATNASNVINGSYIINGTADTATKVTVGNAEGTSSSLTLATSGTDSSIVVGPNTNVRVLSNGNLVLNATDGNITFENSANALNLGTNSKLELNGTKAINFNNSIVSDASSNIVKSGSGKLNIDADMSGVKGTYTQTAGTTEFSDDSIYFQGTSNITNSTLALGKNVDITSNSNVNLNGNAIVEVNNGNKISASAITAINDRNAIRGSEYTINGVAPTEAAEAQYTTVTIGNAAGANSSLAFAVTAKDEAKGNAVVGPYTNINVLSNGNLIFDATGGDITIEKSDNSISLANNATVTLAGSNTINLGNSIQTAESATGNIVVIGDAKSTVNINADMSGANTKYTQNAGTVNVNKAFFAVAADSVAGKDSILNFNNGSSISTDNLTVNEGLITFNENEVTEITDAKFSKGSGYIQYGDNKISLKEAAVTLNNGYVLSTENADEETQQIEIVKGNNGVHSLTLKNSSIDEDTDLNLSNGASLTFDNGSSAKEFSTITIDNSSAVNLANTADSTINIGSDFMGTGTINKKGLGNVVMSGDSSDFSGIYNQTAGKTEFADDSSYFQGTSNITNSTLALGNNVNITSENVINLTGNGIIEANNENKISASVINATNAGNTIKGFNYNINGAAPTEESEAQYTIINIGNEEGLNSSLAISATSKNEAVLNEDGTPVLNEEGNQVYKVINGKASVGSYTDINVHTNGELKLDAAGGDIIIDNSEKAISLDNNSTLTFAGKEIIAVDREFSTLEDKSANVIISEAPIVNLNADMSKAKVKYTQSNGIVNVNNKFFNTQEESSVINNGHLNLNQGAQLVQDITVNNNGSVAFNQNDVSSIEEAVFARENGHVTYGTNNISLSQANVILNNGYVLSAANADSETSKIEIGQTAHQGIKSLTIQDASIGNNADINLENGKLTLKDGAKASQGSVITLDENSVVDFKNNEKTVVINSNISGNGTISKVNEETEQANLGLVQLTGDNSGFIGKYIQNAGTVEFTPGSTFFGNGFSTQITGGELKLADGVKVTNTENIIIPVLNSSLTTEIKNTNADLQAKQVTVGENQAVTFKLENSSLALNKNSNVTTSSNNLVIGNDGSNTLITNLTLGNSAYNPEETVNLNISGDNTITLVNANAQSNVGVLTIGDNINVITNPEAPLALTTNLGDNTAVVLNVSENSPINNKEIALNLNANQAADIANNAKLVKAASGKLLLGGNNSNFNGTVQVDNGSISVQPNSLLGQNVKYSLQKAESNANISLAPLHDTAINPNMDIIGINLADNAVATVANNGIENGTVSVTGATLVDNKSSLKISSADTITLANTKIGSANDTSNGNITLTAKNININNNDAVLVKGEGAYLTLNGESNVAKDFILKNATLNLNGNMNIGGNFSAGSTVNMINNQINTQTIAGNMDLTGNTDYQIDINGVLLQSDKVIANGIITATQPTTLDISKIHFITEPKYDNTLFHVFNDANTNAGQEIDPNVVFTSSTGFVDAPVGKYVMNSVGNGNYMLSRIGYNPYVLAGSVAAQAGYYTQLNSYNLAFSNADMIMALPKNEREAYKNANKYAEAELPSIAAAYPNARYDVDASDKIVIDQSNLIQNQTGGWFRPYGIFENVKLKNGPEVGNNMYGAYVGAESKVKELGHGFDGTLGVYAGYDGSHQTFEGVGVYQNGGTIGLTGSLYKNDFFSLTTANIGASGADQDSIYGSADFWMLRAGLANKTGYNWDLADGKFIIQPHLMMSLSSVSLFSYEAAPNIKIDDESLFTYQLAPGFKFIGNTANGWQPYVSIDMIWNIGGHNNNKANGISLPEMYSEPWLEYGLGLQKRYGERFTGYGQAMFRSIGRNGVALTAGMRWRVGEGR